MYMAKIYCVNFVITGLHQTQLEVPFPSLIYIKQPSFLEKTSAMQSFNGNHYVWSRYED